MRAPLRRSALAASDLLAGRAAAVLPARWEPPSWRVLALPDAIPEEGGGPD